MELKPLETALQDANKIATALLQDQHHGKSPFAGPLRSALTRASELNAEHTKWLAANPEPTAEPMAKAGK